MPDASLTRRGFIAATGAVVAGSLIGCGAARSGPPAPQQVDMTKAYLLSGRGRRVSNAALSHNHNMVFVSPEAADAGRAHPGDNSKIVSVDVKPKTWMAYFGGGATGVDLRKV